MPYPVRDVKRAAEQRGAEYSTKQGKGSHAVFKLPDGRMYTIPATYGLKTEIGDVYIRGLCKEFGWDKAKFIADL